MLSYNVADLLRAGPGTVESIDVELPRLADDDDLVLAEPVTGQIRLSQSGRGILIRGKLKAALAERCSRCLRPAQAPVQIDVEEEALPTVDVVSGDALDLSDEPDAYRIDEHHQLDLVPIIREAISLSEPIAPLCRPDCPGLCAICGADLSSEPDHQHDADDVDPRLAALAGLRDRLP